MLPKQCEWCLSASLGADGKIAHLQVCPLYPLRVIEFSEIPDKHYCSKCRADYTGPPSDHFARECVYENGCPTCERRYIDKYHIERCKNAEMWKKANLPPLTPPPVPKPESPLIILPEDVRAPAAKKPSVNVSSGKMATASSVESYYYKASIVTGRDEGHRWSSQHHDAEWIMIDLGDIYSIDGVDLDWENAHAREYEIMVSINQVIWTIVHSTFFGRGGLENIYFKPIDARYVKMNGIKRATQWGYSLYNFRVYGRETDLDLPMTDRILRKWRSKHLPYNSITIVDERKVPWLTTSAPIAMGK